MERSVSLTGLTVRFELTVKPNKHRDQEGKRTLTSDDQSFPVQVSPELLLIFNLKINVSRTIGRLRDVRSKLSSSRFAKTTTDL